MWCLESRPEGTEQRKKVAAETAELPIRDKQNDNLLRSLKRRMKCQRLKTDDEPEEGGGGKEKTLRFRENTSVLMFRAPDVSTSVAVGDNFPPLSALSRSPR